MNDYAKNTYIKEQKIECPPSYIIVDDKEDIPIEKNDLIWHNKRFEFYTFTWWKENEPTEPNISKGLILQDMIVLRRRAYEPVQPKKLQVIRNVKRLIKR